MTINAAIFACNGPELLASEAVFFRDCNPWGFILFGRNIETPEQVRKLCADLRNTVGRDALIFVDQEGGRVQRLGPPHWRKSPWAYDFGELYRLNKRDALRAIWLNFRMIADDLRSVGITANCAPVLDLPVFGADPIISDRAFSRDPDKMIKMAHACMAGLTAGGIVPVIKHIPGHGRAAVDSHKALPVITESLSELERTDFVPFKALSDAPVAMTAHVVLECVDKQQPITVSKAGFQQVVRQNIGYDGLVMSDDLDMKALHANVMGDGLTTLARKTLAAGCDIVLQCSGQLPDMVKVAKGLKPLAGDALRRAQLADLMAECFEPFSHATALEEYTKLMAQLEPAT
ncbi:MAG: beta-N-acetylhexosaminidase [Robiginitomaculum sp.]|nr:beta-N-acetylhexosaminidase [Robiginitomaculum sp.]